MPHDYTNTVLANRYHLRRCIGLGGMATVYEAIDRELNKPVAVKILNPHYACQSEYLARFRQEAREAARIRHEHLVDVTDQGMSDGIAYFVMEFLRGDTLQGYLHPTDQECRQVPWRTMVQIAVQVCEALQHAHDHGVIHRDIKPANCFLITRRGGDFFIKVLDLGIAKVTQEHRDPSAPPTTRASQGTPGTPEYMSPEQVRGEVVTAQSDVYSLGVMMYRMLTGRLPFFSERSPYETMEQHCKHTPVPPRERAPEADIPESIEREVLRALAKRPEDRHASAQELGDTLKALLDADARRQLVAGDDDESRTLQYRFHTQAPRRSLARFLSYTAASFAGLTLSTALFMVFTLIPVHAQEPDPVGATAVAFNAPPAAKDPTHPATPKAPADSSPIADPPKPQDPPEVAPPPTTPEVSETPPLKPPTRDEAPPLKSPTSEPEPRKPTKSPPPETKTRPVNPAKLVSRQQSAIARRCSSTKLFPVATPVPLTITLDPATGKLVSAVIQGPHAQTSLGVCVKQAVSSIKFPAPGGEQAAFSVTLTL